MFPFWSLSRQSVFLSTADRRHDRDRHTNLFTRLGRDTNGSLCVKDGGVCMRARGRVTCGSVARSWLSARRLQAFGRKTSNRGTAGPECGGKERKCKNRVKAGGKRMVGERRGRENKRQNEMHVDIKGRLVFKWSCLKMPVNFIHSCYSTQAEDQPCASRRNPDTL